MHNRTSECQFLILSPTHQRSDDWGALEAVLAQQAQELSTLKAKLTTAQNKMAVMESEINRLQDSRGNTSQLNACRI